jgi:hypothetical protein
MRTEKSRKGEERKEEKRKVEKKNTTCLCRKLNSSHSDHSVSN